MIRIQFLLIKLHRDICRFTRQQLVEVQIRIQVRNLTAFLIKKVELQPLIPINGCISFIDDTDL